MFCNKCGIENKESANFCKECGQPIEKVDLSYAGFWIRFGAYFVDFIGIILLAVLIGFIETLLNTPELLTKFGIFADYTLWVIYSTFFLSIFSSTPGKSFYGLKILKENGERLDFKTSLKRALLQPLSLFFFGVGYWNVKWNEKQQYWHDKQLNTVVIRERKGNYIFQVIISILSFCIYLYIISLSRS